MGKSQPHKALGQECSGQREWQVQRPWGGKDLTGLSNRKQFKVRLARWAGTRSWRDLNIILCIWGFISAARRRFLQGFAEGVT